MAQISSPPSTRFRNARIRVEVTPSIDGIPIMTSGLECLLEFQEDGVMVGAFLVPPKTKIHKTPMIDILQTSKSGSAMACAVLDEITRILGSKGIRAEIDTMIANHFRTAS